MFYKSKIKPLVDNEMTIANLPSHITIGIIKHNIKKAWDEESEEVWQQVISQSESAFQKQSVPASSLVQTPQDYAL